MKALIIVPAFNEAEVIYKVLKSIPEKFKGIASTKILLVNDGSTDRTKDEASKTNVEIISHIFNRGLGAAIKTGLIYAKKQKVDIAITFDGDGQHNPQDIQKLIDAIASEKGDIVIGSRFKKKQNVPVDRFIINWLANLITFLISGTFSTDSQSGLRAFSKKAIGNIDFKADRMEFSSEILLEAKRNSLRVFEVPIKAIYTTYSRKKGQTNLNALPIFSRLVLKFLR